MIDDDAIEDWFCREVLPLEGSLVRFIQRNWRVADDVADLRNDVYALAIAGARNGLPTHSRAFLFTIARNHLVNRAKRERIVSFDLVADLETVSYDIDLLATERLLSAREKLMRFHHGLERLSPRVREIVHLRKVEGLTTREAAEKLGIAPKSIEGQLALGMRALADFMLGGSGRIERRATLRRQTGKSQP